MSFSLTTTLSLASLTTPPSSQPLLIGRLCMHLPLLLTSPVLEIKRARGDQSQHAHVEPGALENLETP